VDFESFARPINEMPFIFSEGFYVGIFKIFTENQPENSGVRTSYGRYRSKSTKNPTENPD